MSLPSNEGQNGHEMPPKVWLDLWPQGGCVNYKLAHTKSTANDWTTKAFAICIYRDWTPCCFCWPSTIPEGVQGGVRHSVLQGIWWDRSLDSCMLLGTDFVTSILAFPHISVQFSNSVVSDSLWPHESQHTRPPCPSPTPGVHWDSRPSSQWCHPAISSSVVPFSSRLQSFPASGSFFSNESDLRIRWPKYWSFSFSISPSSEHSGLISFRMD